MARPRGEVREALALAMERLYVERGAVSVREVAHAAQVGEAAARVTINDMIGSGEVLVVGSAHLAGQRWHRLLELASAQLEEMPQPWGGAEALAEVVKGWAGAS